MLNQVQHDNHIMLSLTTNYQNFHQGFLSAKLLVADLLLVAAVEAAAALPLSAAPVAALVTLSFRRPFSSHLNLHHKYLLQISRLFRHLDQLELVGLTYRYGKNVPSR